MGIFITQVSVTRKPKKIDVEKYRRFQEDEMTAEIEIHVDGFGFLTIKKLVDTMDVNDVAYEMATRLDKEFRGGISGPMMDNITKSRRV